MKISLATPPYDVAWKYFGNYVKQAHMLSQILSAPLVRANKENSLWYLQSLTDQDVNELFWQISEENVGSLKAEQDPQTCSVKSK